MNKKILLGLGAALLASTLMAGNCGNKQMCGNNDRCSSMGSTCHSKDGFVPAVMSLDLSEEQEAKIDKIKENCCKDAPSPMDALSETNFDKKKFIELSKKQKDAKLERKAQMMADIYAVLTPEQKKALKAKLDQKGKKLPKMMCDAKPKSCATKASCCDTKRDCDGKKSCDTKRSCDGKKSCD
ncbi:MAG: Spy/CpxP family protein refolding chaperone [Sulfurimonadaceae bacterium]